MSNKEGMAMSAFLSGLEIRNLFVKEVKTGMRLSTVLFAVVALLVAGAVSAGTFEKVMGDPPPGTYWDEERGCLVHDPPLRIEMPSSALLGEDSDTLLFDNGFMNVSWVFVEPPDQFALTGMTTPECPPGDVWVLTSALLACFNYPGYDPATGTVVVYEHHYAGSCMSPASPQGDSIGDTLGLQEFDGLSVDWTKLPRATWTQVDFDAMVPVLDSVFYLAWDYENPVVGHAFYSTGFYLNIEDTFRMDISVGSRCSWGFHESGPWLMRALGHCEPGTLDIVEDVLEPSYCPPERFWTDPDTVDVTFHVTSVLGNHRQVTFEATDLIHETRGEHKISASTIEFDPDMFDLIAHGETVEVAARIPIPAGALAGDYEGMFRAKSQESGKEDSVSVVLEVGAIPDMDIDDNEGNLTGNVMHLEGLPDDAVNGTFVMLNPSIDLYNEDAFDGPGNADLPDGTVTFTDLVSIDESDTIPSTEMSLHDINEPDEDPVRAILSGTARHIGLNLDIPSTAGAGTYQGSVTISFDAYSCVDDDTIAVSDVFGVSLNVGAVGGELEIVEGDTLDTLSYNPPDDQWVQDGFVEAQFTLTATGGDVHNVRLYSGDLVHTGLSIKIDGNSVNFSPGEIGSIASGDTEEITARIPIPIGRRTGIYEGSFYAVGDGGAGDSIGVVLELNPVGDLDVQDYAGNLVGNTMTLTGIAGGVVVGRYTVVNPNLPDNNVDLYDGPANDDITEIAVVATDLSLERGGAQGKCKGVELLCVEYIAGGGVEGKCKGVRKISFQYHNSGRGDLSNVKITSKDVTYFMGSVSDGDVITADASPGKLGTNTEILVYDELDQKIHTSCSKPVEIGMVFGDWEIVDIEKITEGGGGGAPSPAYVEIKSNGVTYFAGTIEHGDTICADARPFGKLGTNTEIFVDGYLNAKIHTSCSKPLEIGMQFGNFVVTDLIKRYEGTKEGEISSDNVDGNVNGITTIISGAAEDFLLQITIPAKGIKHYDPKEDQTYKGTVTVQGRAVNANIALSDEFDLELMIVKAGGRTLTSGFWGEPGGSGTLLRWTGFGLNETGYAVYRALNGSYTKLTDLSGASRSFLDGETRSGLIYEYKLGLKIGGSEVMIGPILIKASDRLPGGSYLSQSFPNPTSGATMFRFGVVAKSHVSISMYNVAGQMVNVMVDERKLPGIYSTNWDSSEFANGIYFCRMNVEPTDGQGKQYTASRKVVVLR